MSFKSYRSSQSKFRRSNRRNVAAQAEPCELRALLSASAITVGLAEAAPCDATEVEVGTVSDDSPTAGGAEGKISDVVDQGWGCLIPCDGFMPTEFDGMEGDATDGDVPPMRLMFYQAAFVDDAGIADDSVPVEKTGFDELAYTDENVTEDGVVLEELVAIEDTPPVDGWDPPWLYRSFTGSPDGGLDDAVKIDDIVLEDGVPVDYEVTVPEDVTQVDGWDQSWAWRTLDSPDEEPVDSDGHGLPDDFVAEPFDSDGTFDPSILMSFGGSVDGPEDAGIEGADGETKEVVDSKDPRVEEELYLYPVDEVIDFENMESPVAVSDDSLRLQIRSFSAAGGSEAQRMLTSSAPAVELTMVAVTPAAPATAATAPPMAALTQQSSIPTDIMPVQQVASNSLFNSSRDKAAIGVALTSQSDGGPIGSTIGTKSSSTPKRSKSQLQSIAHNSDKTSGLESLSPLIGDEADSPEVDAAPSHQDVQSEEQVTAEPTVISRNESVESSSSVVVQSTRSSRTIRPGMIDEVMSQYAENSYNA